MADNDLPPFDRRSNTDVSFQTYIDAQLTEMRRAIEVASMIPTEVVPLREFIIELIQNLKDYFIAIMDEQRRATVVAEQEREKSARALRLELERAINEGDANLREHIHQQIVQIQAALEASERLEQQRIDACNEKIGNVIVIVNERIESVLREITIINEASETAIAKAESANERRFESVNEFRAQLAEQTSSFLPREVADAQFAEIRRSVSELTEKINRVV